jgi:hypothetical protein
MDLKIVSSDLARVNFWSRAGLVSTHAFNMQKIEIAAKTNKWTYLGQYIGYRDNSSRKTVV